MLDPGMRPQTLPQLPRPSRAFLLALLLLVGARLVIGQLSQRLETVPNGDLDTFVYYQKEFAYRTGDPPSPRVLLVGSSRIQYLLGKNLADALQMPESEVGSYGFAASNFWTYWQFLQRNPALLDRCEILMLDCMPGSYFYVPYVQGRTRSVFTRYADVGLRSTLPTIPLRLEALGDLAFPMWSYRNNPLGWRVFFEQLPMTPEERVHEYVTTGTLTNSAARYRPLPKADDETVKTDLAPKPVPYTPAIAGVRGILAMAPPACKIVFWMPPLRSDFAAEAEQRDDFRESFTTFRRDLEALGDPRVRIVWYNDPGATAFAPSEFKDPDHYINEVIQTKLAAEAARVIRTQLTR